MAGFTNTEWAEITSTLEREPEAFGLPERRERSVVIGTFNMLKLGRDDDDAKRWDFLRLICERFDLLALQEVMDNLDGLRRLKRSLGPEYGVVVSDVTGVFPTDRGNTERLAFLFRWPRIRRDELASDITYDRSKVLQLLYENRDAFWDFFQCYDKRLAEAEANGGKRPSLTDRALPAFLTFIRQPHCASFSLLGPGDSIGPQFLAVNAHLLYGRGKQERRAEFDALLDWLILRASQRERLYHPNLLLLGDLNLEFQDAEIQRDAIDRRLRALNANELAEADMAKVNFPLLSKHPNQADFFRTNARLDQTYDQIALFADANSGLPTAQDNKTAGQQGPDGYDYGVFNFANLFAQAIHQASVAELSEAQQKALYRRGNADVSDHMPAWIRLPMPPG